MKALEKECRESLFGSNVTFFREKEPLFWQIGLKCAAPQSHVRAVTLCLKPKLMRFHLSDSHFKPIQSVLGKKISEKLYGHELTQFHLLGGDRILELSFKGKYEKLTLVVQFFEKSPNLLLLDAQKRVVVALKGDEGERYVPPHSNFKHEIKEVQISSGDVEERFAKLDAEHKLSARKEGLKRFLEKKRNSAAKRVRVFEADLQKSEVWPNKEHEMHLLQVNFDQLKGGMAEIRVKDWENGDQERVLKLDPKLSPHVNLQRKSKEIKKLKGAVQHAMMHLESSRELLLSMESEIGVLENMTNPDHIEEMGRKHKFAFDTPSEPKITKREKTHPYREYVSGSGARIFAGKGASDNDALSFRFARGNDTWLHVSGFPGSHVIIRTKGDESPDHETLLDAMQVAVFYSKGKKRYENEVTVSKAKYVSKRKGCAPGQVFVANAKYHTVKTDPERFKRLKERATDD